MNCPICGKELSPKARKCDKCGCRPQYLYGRPPMPKWIIPTAIALVVVILAGSLFFVLRPSSKSENYQMSLLLTGTNKGINTSYSYDEMGNLEEATHRIPFDPMLGALVPRTVLRAEFCYDEDGIFTEVRIFTDEESEPYKVGTVKYYEEENAVAVHFGADGIQKANQILFRYNQDGRLEEYTYSAPYEHEREYEVSLEYDESGRLISNTILECISGGSWHEYYMEIMKYGADENEIVGYTMQYIATGDKIDYICENDQWGNVLVVGLPNQDTGVIYEYSRQLVSAQTARQYELQMYLLDALGLSSHGIVFPVVKTPC